MSFARAIAALLLAASPVLARAGDVVTIEITKFSFSPKVVTIKPGTTVRWINHDETPHTVQSTPGQAQRVASKAMDTDDKFEEVITATGDIAYFCTVHPFMTGMIHIRK